VHEEMLFTSDQSCLDNLSIWA